MSSFRDKIANRVHEVSAIGTSFWLKKTLTSSDITSVAQDLTADSERGELLIEDVVVKTDATGLAGGGTNFQLLTNNAKGAGANVFAHAVSSLGGSAIQDLRSATTGVHGVLEEGKNIQYKADDDGTGSGTIDVYVKLRRLSTGANVVEA